MQAVEVYRDYAMEIDTHEVDYLVKNTSELEISRKRKVSNDESPTLLRIQKRNKLASPRKSVEESNECSHLFSAGPLPVNSMDELFVVGREDLCLNDQLLPKGTIIIEKGWTFNSKLGRADKVFQILPEGAKGRISIRQSNNSMQTSEQPDSYTLLLEYSRKLTFCEKCQKWSI